MTGPEGSTPPPGWYPDPDGSPGLVRWWNGISWSDVATPAGPGVKVERAPAWSAQPSRPVAESWSPVPPASPGPDNRAAWLTVGGALLLVVAVVVGLVIARGGDEPATPVADPGTAAPPAAPSGPTFPPGTVQIIDEEAGIAYPFLGTGWYEWSLGEQYEMTSIAGQFFTTQEEVPSGGIFIAQCTSGPLADTYGYAGAGTLQSTVAAVADSVRGNYYPAPNERRVLRDEARDVDGHAAHLYEFQLSWEVEGYDASGERAALLLIDVGRPAPALLYVSIPNTHAELYGVIDRLINSVEVLE